MTYLYIHPHIYQLNKYLLSPGADAGDIEISVLKNLSRILLGIKEHGKRKCNIFIGAASICVKMVIEKDYSTFCLEHGGCKFIWF